MVNCKVCDHPRALEIMQQVYAGKITYVEAARELDLPIPTVWNCFKEHWQITDQGLEQKQAKSTEDYVAVLKELIEKFITRLSAAMDLPVSSYNDAAVTRLSKELRGLMRDILEFEGKLRTGPLVQLTILQSQFTKLTSILVSKLCEDCKRTVLNSLSQLLEEERTETIRTPSSHS